MSDDPAPRLLPDDFLYDPARTYRALRAEGPIHHVVLPNGMPTWLIVDYEPARRALADPRLGKDAAIATALVDRQAAARGRDGFGADLPEHMLNSDPPDHDRLRKLVNRAFTASAVERMRPRVEQITTRLLDALEDGVAAGEPVVDLIDTFAYPLPIAVICELLGVPDIDRDRFRAWSDVVLSSTGPDSEEIVDAFRALTTYLSDLVTRRREHPGGGDTLVDALIDTAEDADRLTDDELISTLFLMLVAGFETTANLIGNGTLALLRNADELARLRADPSLLPGAVEELLRRDSPTGIATLRHTTAPWTVGEVTVPAGEFVTVALLGANHDPRRYPDPDRLDITRRTAGHLAFGHGIHFCVGAPLARLEATTAFRGLLTRFPDLELACDPTSLTWRPGTLTRGLTELPIRLRRRTPAESTGRGRAR